MRLTDWGFRFTQEYRYESSTLEAEEKECFEPFVEENLLSKPCQVEIIRFSRPFRFVLLFFLDKTKPDLIIRVQKEDWRDLATLVDKLGKKYHSLHLNSDNLWVLLDRCRRFDRKSLFAFDFTRTICLICFTHDPRIKGSPFPWELHYLNSPKEVAKMILHLNVDQGSCYFEKHGL